MKVQLKSQSLQKIMLRTNRPEVAAALDFYLFFPFLEPGKLPDDGGRLMLCSGQKTEKTRVLQTPQKEP